MTACTIDGCGRTDRVVRGMCSMHYTRWLRHGDPLRVAYVQGDDLRRLLSYLEWGELPAARHLGPCVLWTGVLNPAGYPDAGTGRTGHLPPARFFYELNRGPVPIVEGRRLDLDHLCHTLDPSCPGKRCIHRRCVNPWHLEIVTRGENARRASTRLTHCSQGHALTPDNVYARPGQPASRACRMCRRERDRRYKAARRRGEHAPTSGA